MDQPTNRSGAVASRKRIMMKIFSSVITNYVTLAVGIGLFIVDLKQGSVIGGFVSGMIVGLSAASLLINFVTAKMNRKEQDDES